MELQEPLSQQTPQPVDTAGQRGDCALEETRHTLADLQGELAYFIPTLLQAYGRFPADPVAEFNLHFPAEPDRQAFAIDSNCGHFFQNDFLGNVAEPQLRRIYAICRERWGECREFLARLTTLDHATQWYAETCYHEIKIPDRPAMLRHPANVLMPHVAATAFAVNGNKLQAWLSDMYMPASAPFIIVRPPTAEMRLKGDKLWPPTSN